jgi:dipeptidyl aminopeptidase/acylaminoacyl peptidase
MRLAPLLLVVTCVICAGGEVTVEFLPAPADAPPQAAAPAPAQAPPDTEIYLAPLTLHGDRIELGTPRNVSNNPGYDNQPAFTPDGSAILFTSARGGTQTDIYRYDIAGGRVTQITNTPESEYSPTITPANDLSVVRVEADRTQRLWRFTMDGRDPRVVLADVKPVGYHAWIDDGTLALYVLGQPATLQIADTRTGAARVVATDIGRSVKQIPGGKTISFVQRERSGESVSLTIEEFDPATGAATRLVRAPDGATEADCAWTPDGLLLLAFRDHLYGWRRGWPAMRELAAFDVIGLHDVTRLAVSPKTDALAIVASPPR